MNRESRKALSLEMLAKHQQRIKQMVQKIEHYKPIFHMNKKYKKYDIEKRIEKREIQSDKLFEQNMKLIYRIQTTGPKIQTKKFPEVKLNPRRLKTLSNQKQKSQSHSKFKTKIIDSFRNQEELFEQNMKIITNIECTGPKIQCWTSKKILKLNELAKSRKREEEKKILEKFKQISKQLNKVSKMRSFKRSSSITSLTSKRSS